MLINLVNNIKEINALNMPVYRLEFKRKEHN